MRIAQAADTRYAAAFASGPSEPEPEPGAIQGPACKPL
jgi:hypothetical protein